MSRLHITMKGSGITITPKLQALVEQKLTPLDKFFQKEDEIRCAVELEKTAEHHSGKIYRAELNLTVHGTLIRAEATEEQIEQAIDVARNELKRELQHQRGKRQSLANRGRRTLKKMLRGE